MPFVKAGRVADDRFVRIADDAPLPDGGAILVSGARYLADAEALQRRALGRQPNPVGKLKLSICDTSLFDPLRLLAELHKQHPRIELWLDRARDAAARLSQLQVDAALVIGNAPPEELIGRQLGRVRLSWFCSARYSGRRAPPAAEDCAFIVWAGSNELDEVQDTRERMAMSATTTTR